MVLGCNKTSHGIIFRVSKKEYYSFPEVFIFGWYKNLSEIVTTGS